MASIVEVNASDLPDYATHGFRIVGDEEGQVLFFHWNDTGEHEGKKVTTYADVLAAVEDRMTEMGMDKRDIPHLLGEVVGRYGAG